MNSFSKTIKIPFSLWVRTKMMTGLKPIYQLLGQLETYTVKQEIAEIKIQQPIYVCGLARSGTTIISQLLSEHSDTCHHSYSDFPEIFFPYWKNWVKKHQINFNPKLTERAHQDRLWVNNNSIEAFEEVLWMTYVKNLHQNGLCKMPSISEAKNFKKHYQTHIKKMLAVHNKTRYLSKANYNVNRIELILNYFPDAKFIIPIRHPINHVASLVKQHSLFTTNASNKINIQLAASGHFEFGEIREIIEFDRKESIQKIKKLWANGDEIAGWAVYWNYLYNYVLKLKDKSPALNNAIKIVKYEDICFDSLSSIKTILKHSQLSLDNENQLIKKYTQLLSPPEYYIIPFSQSEKNAIMSASNEVTKYFDYNIDNHL